jgi:hypothetical protein
MSFWRSTRALLVFLTFVALATFAKAIDVEIKTRLQETEIGGRVNLPDVNEQLLSERPLKKAEEQEARPRSKVIQNRNLIYALQLALCGLPYSVLICSSFAALQEAEVGHWCSQARRTMVCCACRQHCYGSSYWDRTRCRCTCTPSG